MQSEVEAAGDINYKSNGFQWRAAAAEPSADAKHKHLTPAALQQLREKTKLAQGKMDSLVRDCEQFQQNDSFRRTAYERSAAGAEYVQTSVAQRNLSLAWRWRNIVNSLLQVRGELLKYALPPGAASPVALLSSLLQRARRVLEDSCNFYDCQLGENDANWAQFVDVQKVRILNTNHLLLSLL